MRRLASFVAIGALAVAAMADARPARPLGPQSDELSVAALHDFAHCVVGRAGTRASAALLDMDYESPAYSKALRNLATGHGQCLSANSRMEFNGSLLAGAMAEILLAREPGGYVSRLGHDPSEPPFQARDEGELTGMCIARAEPAKVAALLGTEATSEAETRAIRDLGPALVACVKAGRPAHFNRPGLRALLALSAYHLVQHSKASSAPVGN